MKPAKKETGPTRDVLLRYIEEIREAGPPVSETRTEPSDTRTEPSDTCVTLSALSAHVLLRYIEEIDRFANQLREAQERIRDLEADCSAKREAFEIAKLAVREEKDVEHATVTMLLKFVTPGLETLNRDDREACETATEAWE